MKILLVEDSATLRHAMSSYIADAGHTPVIAESGEKALQLIEQTPVDMIIMDVEMPGLNGFETTRLIREWLEDRWLPIVFVTGKNEDESYREGIDAGGDDYLIKPVSPVILQAKIKAMERIADMRDQLNRLNKELETLSQFDSLTGLLNRRTLAERAKQQWQIMARHKRPISVLMMDVDHFKRYNDHYGHPAGDACLQQVASSLKKSLHRPADLVGRYGGEEFIVVLPETDQQGATHVAENIRQALYSLALEHAQSPTDEVVTMSIGGATSIYTTGRSLEDVIKQADEALYRAKQRGRNCVEVEEYAPHQTVLIVEHEPDSMTQACGILRNHCNILATDNGNEALAMTAETQPDLIMLEAGLPGLNGLDICRELKANSDTAPIPIILMSADRRGELVRMGKSVGANDCLSKPLNAHQLLAKVNDYLL